MTFSIVPTHLAVKAMRDNGYRNAAYAVAELMDNSIQAGARNVELLCAEQISQLEQRQRRRIFQIGVLDDACGMSAEVMRMALQFGNGTRLSPDLQTGIGRFGMGLPASSISQCKRVEVWSWQNGVENALYTYLDLDEISSQRMKEVPEPASGKVPDVWRKAGAAFGESGTLVVWSELDRIAWKTALAIADNAEFVIGRMYRRFLDNKSVTIRMVGFDYHQPLNKSLDRLCLPNDPGYLMIGTSTPSPWDREAMFEPWGGGDFEVRHEIAYRGAVHPVTIRYSVAKEKARGGINPGARDYGRHAAKNAGVSIVRADRELELDSGWTAPSDPRDRWWGVEVEFPPALDEVFGVTNNKQHAHKFSELAGLEADMLKSGKSLDELREQMKEDDDDRGVLLEIASQIHRTLAALRKLLRMQTASNERSERRRHTAHAAETRATEATRHRQEEGHHGSSDDGEARPPEERQQELKIELEKQGIPAEAASQLAATTVSDGLKYVFAEADLETPAFFSVRQRGGSILITLNTSHPAYENLVEVLETGATEDDVAQLQQRLARAADGLKLLLMAWARFEDEQPDGGRRTAAQDTRIDWGRLARQFLQ